MKRESVSKLLPIIQAFGEGKIVEHLAGGEWIPLDAPDFCDNPKFYRVKPEPEPDPHAELKSAYASGKTIQSFCRAFDAWVDLGSPLWCDPPSTYRIKPEPDPYAEVKAAHAAGKTIQVRLYSGYWVDVIRPAFNATPDRYRVKPDPTPAKASDSPALSESFDAVDRPKHYASDPSGYECVQIAEKLDGLLFNAFKYLWRAGGKGDEIEDLKKARWYMARYAGIEGVGPPRIADCDVDLLRVVDTRPSGIGRIMQAVFSVGMYGRGHACDADEAMGQTFPYGWTFKEHIEALDRIIAKKEAKNA